MATSSSSKRSLRSGCFRAILRVAIGVGAVKILRLSEKGRLTIFVLGIEPFIRRKLLRFKWFPPVLICSNPCASPNLAVEEYFAKRVVFVSRGGKGILAESLDSWPSEIPDRPVGIFRKIKRRGSPWEMSPSTRRRDDWSYETNALLESMGIPSGAPIVLLAVRDPTYYSAIRESRGEWAGEETLSDTFIRNPNLETYSLAISQLRERGLTVVYFGFPTSLLPPSLVGQVVDYPGRFRSPRGDLLLGRHSTMLLSGGSGAWALSSLFNKPVAFSDSYHPFVGGFRKSDRAIFQLIRDTRDGRIFSFREMALTKGRYSYRSNCDRDGIELIKNSSEEIADLAIETLDRHHGQFVSLPGDDELQRRFSAIQAGLPPRNGEVSLSAMTFLRRHAHLID